MGLVQDDDAKPELLPYGDQFTYDEAIVVRNSFAALQNFFGLVCIIFALKFVPLVCGATLELS